MTASPRACVKWYPSCALSGASKRVSLIATSRWQTPATGRERWSSRDRSGAPVLHGVTKWPDTLNEEARVSGLQGSSEGQTALAVHGFLLPASCIPISLNQLAHISWTCFRAGGSGHFSLKWKDSGPARTGLKLSHILVWKHPCLLVLFHRCNETRSTGPPDMRCFLTDLGWCDTPSAAQTPGSGAYGTSTC